MRCHCRAHTPCAPCAPPDHRARCTLRRRTAAALLYRIFNDPVAMHGGCTFQIRNVQHTNPHLSVMENPCLIRPHHLVTSHCLISMEPVFTAYLQFFLTLSLYTARTSQITQFGKKTTPSMAPSLRARCLQPPCHCPAMPPHCQHCTAVLGQKCLAQEHA